MVNAVQPQTPPIAQQQGITGEVTVVVTLDAQSQLVSAAISQSPSALLDNAALAAARASTYQTEIVNCKPVGDSFRLLIEFQAQ